MAGKKEITALPSVLVYHDGSERFLDELSAEERRAWELKALDRMFEVVVRDCGLVAKLLEKQKKEEKEKMRGGKL